MPKKHNLQYPRTIAFTAEQEAALTRQSEVETLPITAIIRREVETGLRQRFSRRGEKFPSVVRVVEQPEEYEDDIDG